MGPSRSAENRQTATDAAVLLDLADAGIVAGLRGDAPSPPAGSDLPVDLRSKSGVFVTLTVSGSLNGCIGTIEGVEPLGRAVHRLAHAAAFSDPRLPPLTVDDYESLTIEVSVLSRLERIGCTSRRELLAELDVGIDGLVIAAGGREGVFLPSVWAQLPHPESFLDNLYRKAGLARGTWPRGMQASRFTAEKYHRSIAGREGQEGRQSNRARPRHEPTPAQRGHERR